MNFSLFARPYHWMTHHRLWRENMREVAKHLPPSGAQLTLLDVGCGSGQSMHDLKQIRPDIFPIGLDSAHGMIALARQRTSYPYLVGDGTQIPLPENSVDAVFMQRVYYFVGADVQKKLLAEILRVLRPGGRFVMVNPADKQSPFKAWRELRHGLQPALDMFAWHLVANQIGGFTPQSMAERLETAGFARILAEPVVNGWAILGRGEKPYAEGTSTVERIKIGAAGENFAQILQGKALQRTPGKFIHVLVKQTPNKPVWALTPQDKIAWSAAAILVENQPTLLAFTTLPKAVSFMQAAVMAGTIQGINKVAKFSKITASEWPHPVLLNPASLDGHALVPSIALDPTTAEAPDE